MDYFDYVPDYINQGLAKLPGNERDAVFTALEAQFEVGVDMIYRDGPYDIREEFEGILQNDCHAEPFCDDMYVNFGEPRCDELTKIFFPDVKL